MNYRKAILLHAYAVPLGLGFVIALILLVAPAKFNASQEAKLSDYQAFTSLNEQVVAVEGRLSQKRQLMAAWRQTLEGEFVTSVNETLRGKLDTLDDKQLDQDGIGGRPDGGNGLAVTGGQPATRMRMEFRGGYEPMQETLLMMESKYPQMQLEGMDITEDSSGQALRFDLTYTIWEKSPAPSK